MHWRSRTNRPIPEYERGATILSLFFLLLPIALVGGVCIGYAALVGEPVQYQVGIYADR